MDAEIKKRGGGPTKVLFSAPKLSKERRCNLFLVYYSSKRGREAVWPNSITNLLCFTVDSGVLQHVLLSRRVRHAHDNVSGGSNKPPHTFAPNI